MKIHLFIQCLISYTKACMHKGNMSAFHCMRNCVNAPQTKANSQKPIHKRHCIFCNATNCIFAIATQSKRTKFFGFAVQHISLCFGFMEMRLWKLVIKNYAKSLPS